MIKALKLLLPLIFLATSIISLGGCSKKSEEAKKPELKAPDAKTGIREPDFIWAKATAPQIDFFYQPTDSSRLYAQPLANKVSEVYLNISGILGNTNPLPIEFYCYTSQEMLRDFTGRTDPFFIDNKIYYGYGPPFGEVFCYYVISKLPGGESKFSFIRDGVPMLLDYSGRNYHHATNNFLQDGTITPLTKLMHEDTYAALQGGQKLVEGASLCGYLMSEYGYDKFMQLYHENGKIEDALKKTLNTDIDTIEKGWRAFVPEHTDEKEAEREKAQQGGAK